MAEASEIAVASRINTAIHGELRMDRTLNPIGDCFRTPAPSINRRES